MATMLEEMKGSPVQPGANTIPVKYLPGLDPQWQRMWSTHGKDVIGAHLVSIDEVRASPTKYSFTYPTWKGPDVHNVQDYTIPVANPNGTIICRVYTPPGKGPFPVHLNFHGGGWVLGGLGSETAWCRSICNEISIIVIDVDYRLAPQFPFPTAIYDCWAAVEWALTHADVLNANPDSISIGGLSSGGLITAVLAHFARDRSPPVALRLQLMIVPATDMRYVPVDIHHAEPITENTCTYPSAIMFSDLPWSPLARESWFLNYYIGTNETLRAQTLNDWRMTPVLSSNLAGLAPAHIVTAEFDVERDEGEFYGELLRQAGNTVSIQRYAGVPHAFAHYNHPERGLAKSHEFIKDTADLLARAHGARSNTP